MSDTPQAPDSPPVPWVRPRFDPDPTLMAALEETLASGQVTNGGPAVAELEKAAASFLGAKDAIAVSSGSMALLLGTQVLRRKGRAILPSFTYMSTAAALAHAGLELHFCDVDPERWTLDPKLVLDILRTHDDVALVAPVNVYGVPPDLHVIGEHARSYGAAIVYDDAHGFGSRYGHRRHPRGADIRALSLHATKILPAVEGGLVLCRDPAVAQRVRQLAAHGLHEDPARAVPGYNARFDEIRARIALHGLANLEDTLSRRHADSLRIRRAVVATQGFFVNQHWPPDCVSACTNLAVRVPSAETGDIEEVQAELLRGGVESRRYFHPALHQMETFHWQRELPVTEGLCRSVICLPLHSRMEEDDIARVEAAIHGTARALG